MGSILGDFTTRLRDSGRNQGFFVAKWNAAKPITRHILEIDTPSGRMLLYVKVRSQPPGFWGLTVNRIAEIKNSGISWFVVLLLGSPTSGYLLPKHEVQRCTSNGHWTLSGDGDYKVNEGQYLNEKFAFDSFDRFIASLTEESG